MGIKKLREIQTLQDLQALPPIELLSLIHQTVKEIDALQAQYNELREKLNWATQQIALLSHKLFGESSKDKGSKDPSSGNSAGGNTDCASSGGLGSQEEQSKTKPKKEKKQKIQKPSDRYPNVKVLEEEISSDPPPCCPNCNTSTKDTGMTEDSEVLHVIPKQYIIIRRKRKKYACGRCHRALITAKALACIQPGGSYSDDMIIDVTLGKYCDLIPIERYASIAERQGLEGLPPHSLIEGTHYLAKLLAPIYQRIRNGVLSVAVLAADETPHKMLEGSHTMKWFLWGFSSREEVFYEAHSTRSGDVASNILLQSKCEVLLSDVYSGYGKAIREANKIREDRHVGLILTAFCNAHPLRKFKDIKKISKKAIESIEDIEDILDSLEEPIQVFPGDYQYFLDQYREIYILEDQVRDKPLDIVSEQRKKMLPYFEAMKVKCEELKDQYPNQHLMSKAMNYYKNNYEGFTLCLTDSRIPLDNNLQESRFRNPAVGRKTWYGTHSILGAKTAATHFTLVESCKLIKVNPRPYYRAVVTDLLNGGQGFTPLEWKTKLSPSPPPPTSSPKGRPSNSGVGPPQNIAIIFN